ncbi:MAG: hypothetical protein H8E66_05565 [Planctomycetes bacterium]|nr:hypothetical protein [Planctomycetota bacterium]
MQPFHVVIRANPNTELPTTTSVFAGVEVDAMIVPPELQAMRMDVSFEEAAEILRTFPRMFFEPDGSFVWVSSSDEEVSWQIDGNLYDRDGSLIAVDLKGTCCQKHLTRLLDVFRADRRELMVEILREAAFVRERDFLEAL